MQALELESHFRVAVHIYQLKWPVVLFIFYLAEAKCCHSFLRELVEEDVIRAILPRSSRASGDPDMKNQVDFLGVVILTI